MQWKQNQTFSYSHLPLLKHALATPLTSILISAEQALERTKPDEKQYLPLNTIYHQTRHAVSILKMADSYLATEQRFMFSQILSELENMFPKNTGKRLLIFSHCKTELLIEGPKTHFLEAMICLINNAFEAYQTNKTKIVLFSCVQANKNLQIKISDGGLGMNHFQRSIGSLVGKSGKKNHTGLGLAYVRHIIQWYFKGEVKIESRKQLGTTVQIQIPC